jgi:hypothetical protein
MQYMCSVLNFTTLRWYLQQMDVDPNEIHKMSHNEFRKYVYSNWRTASH